MRRIPKQIRYDEHALRRMRERGVSREQVERTIDRPHATRPARRPRSTRFEFAFSSRRRLAVIAEEFKTEIWIISVFWM